MVVTPTQYFEVGRGEMQANFSLISLRFYSKNAPGPFAPSVRTPDFERQPERSISENGLPLRLRVLHTRDMRGLHPPSRQARELAESQRNAGVKLLLTALPPSASQMQLAEGRC